MTVYSFWVFDKHANCVLHRGYQYPATPESTHNGLHPGPINTMNNSHESKLLFGMLYSLRNISTQLVQPTTDDNQWPTQLSNDNPVLSLHTLNYTIHTLSTISGNRLVVLTDREHAVPEIQSKLHQLQCILFKWLIKNPWSNACSSSSHTVSGNCTIVSSVDAVLLS